MIDNKFNLYDKVKIIPLDADGVVIAISYDCMGLAYKVRYFNQGKAEEVYFLDWELKSA